jgi:2-methylisocitrate lyase-like PEP mutase family enzyme
MSPKDLAVQFRAYHHQPSLLILPNVWDAGSARLMQNLGAKCIATTSSGLAWAHGYADGDRLPVAVHAAAIELIARVTSLPITVDAEGGYGSEPSDVGDNIARLIGAGAVGINIEDGNATPGATCRKIEAVREVAARLQIDLFVNVRTDVFLKQLSPGREVKEILDRACLYKSAGGDGLFVPGMIEPTDILAVVQGQSLPVNVMAQPGLPPAADLRQLGVRRLSAGAAIAQRNWQLTGRLAESFLAQGSTPELFADGPSYPEINGLFG